MEECKRGLKVIRTPTNLGLHMPRACDIVTLLNCPSIIKHFILFIYQTDKQVDTYTRVIQVDTYTRVIISV
jgi:hypothetical protein